MDAVQLLNMLLDVIDATAGMVTIVSVWYTWVMPPRRDPRMDSSPSSGAAEIDLFLYRARSCAGTGAGGFQQEQREPVRAALPWWKL